MGGFQGSAGAVVGWASGCVEPHPKISLVGSLAAARLQCNYQPSTSTGTRAGCLQYLLEEAMAGRTTMYSYWATTVPCHTYRWYSPVLAQSGRPIRRQSVTFCPLRLS